MALPLIYTPITKVQNSWSDVPGGQFCREYYMDFIRCASRVGWHRGQYECKKESADFSECIFHNKQVIVVNFIVLAVAVSPLLSLCSVRPS